MVPSMARIARVVVPGLPHHVTQRGNRGGKVFFKTGDYALYRRLLAEAARKARVEIWAYCLMPNHVHVIAVPKTADGLRAAFADAHRRYSAHVNAAHGWIGHLWAGRFASVAMDEAHLMAAARYVTHNPVRARLVKRPQDWRWSSARAHAQRRDDELATVRPLLDRAKGGEAFLNMAPTHDELDALRRAERTGRPLGAPAFVRRLELRLDRTLAPQKRGPKPGGRAVTGRPTKRARG